MKKLVLGLTLVGWVGLSASLTDAVQVDPARKNLVVEQTLRSFNMTDPTAAERAASANALLDIRMESGMSDKVILVMERSPRVNFMEMKDEGKIVLDLFETVNLLEPRTVLGPIDFPALRARTSQFEVLENLTSRVVLDLANTVHATHEVTSDGLVITLSPDGNGGGNGGGNGNGGDEAESDMDTLEELQPIELKPLEEEPLELPSELVSGEPQPESSAEEEDQAEEAADEDLPLTEESGETLESLQDAGGAGETEEETPLLGSDALEKEVDALTDDAADLLTDAEMAEDFLDMAALDDEPQDKIVTISFAAHTSLVEAINALARVGGLNVVVDPAVQGEVTARLVNVPLRVAMKSLLIVNGYDYIEKEGVYRVVPLEKTGQTDVETKTLIRKLEYVDATKVEKSVKEFVTKEYGTLAVDAGSNTVVVKDIPPIVDNIETMLDAFDQRTMQVYVEAAVIDVRVEEGTAFGFNWYGPTTNYGDWGTAGLYSPYFEYDSTSPFNSRLWEDYTSGYGNASLLDGILMTGPQQLLANLTGSGGAEYVDTDTVRALFTGLDPITNTIHGIFGGFVPASLQNVSTLTANFQILTDQFGFEGVISAADNTSDVEVLAMPTILTMDNKEAVVSVVEKLPYVEYRYDEDTGVVTDVQYQTEDVKIELLVKPHITTDNQVLMDVRINKDEGEYETFTIFGGIQTQFPSVTERYIETSTVIVDGNTLVMGGLRDTREQKITHAIPFLGRLPLIGWLFRGEDVGSRDYELVIFLTPHVIEPEFQITERDRNLYETMVTQADNATIDPYNRLSPYYDMHHRSEYISPHDLRTVPGGKDLKKDGPMQWKYW